METENCKNANLTIQQEAQWFLANCFPEDTRYNIGLGVRISGALDVDSLGFALKRLAARTAVLRSTFPSRKGRPCLLINERLEPEFSCVDAENWDELTLARQFQAWYARPFDLAAESSLRMCCYRRGQNASILVVCAHHIITDFTSLGLILDALEAFYLEETDDRTEHWLTPARPFSDYVEQEHARLGEADPFNEEYWLRYLHNPPEALKWDSRWRQGGFAAASHCLTIDGLRHRAIMDFVGKSGASLYTVMAAAWAVAIAGESGSRDMIIGMPTSMRDADFQYTIGSLFTVLPLRLCIDGSFQSIVQQAKSGLCNALDHRHFNLAHAVEKLEVKRSAERNPLFQTTVNMLGRVGQTRWLDLQMAPPSSQVKWADLVLSPWTVNQQEGQVDIALEFIDASSELRCVLKADPRSFSQEGICAFAERFLCVLDRVLAAPHEPLENFPAAWEQDYNAVPGPLNMLPQFETDIRSLVDWVDRRACMHPDQIAVREGEKALDYKELQRRSINLAGQLFKKHGYYTERIGIALPPGIDCIVAILSAMRAGAAYVPLDIALPDERLRRIINQSDIKLIVGNAQTLKGSLCVQAVLDLDDQHEDVSGSVSTLFDLSTPETLAYSVFTSGSTGDPKGIDVEQRSVVTLLASMYKALEMGSGLVWSWFHAASFDLSVWEIWGALCSGGTLLVVPAEVRGKPDRLLDLYDQAQVNIITQTPSGMKNLLGEFLKRPVMEAPLHWVVCGEALPGPTAKNYLNDRWKVWNLYGPAEATVFTSIELVTEELAHHATVPLGRPLSCSTLYLIDDQTVPAPGKPGEIVIGGAGVSRGYVNLADAASQRFIEDPYLPSNRAYRTGDMGYWDGERIHFCGRLDDQVKISGYRVEPGEIERCLESHDQVRQAAVFGEMADGCLRLVAVIQSVDDNLPLQEKLLRDHLRKRLPAYMVPTRLQQVSSLPCNRHGKLDRQSIKQRWQQTGNSEPPANQIAGRDASWRSRLTSIWCEVLGRTDIGVDEAFFDIGGNSMALLQVYGRLQFWVEGQPIVPSDLFRFPTIRSLCEFIQSNVAVPPAQIDIRGKERRQKTLKNRRKMLQSLDIEEGSNV